MGGRVVVIGGGITGLAAANRLRDAAPGAHVILLEAATRLGGKVATEQADGFIIEHGPESFLAAKPRGVGLSEELALGHRLQGVTPREKRAFVRFRSRLYDLPEGLSGLVPTRLAPLFRSPLLSPAGKARIALDYALPARKDAGDESVGGFVRRRLGREAWERLVEPLMAGIYGGDGDRLSLQATFPHLREAELTHGGLIRGVLASQQAAQGVPTRSGFLAPAGGLGELTAALTERLRQSGAEVRLNAPAQSVDAARAGYDIALAGGERIAADAVIVAAPAFAAAEMLGSLDAALAAELAAIPHASSAIVTLAWRRNEIPHPLSGHGYVVPRVEGGPILASTWSSRKWAGRAPEGWELIRIFLRQDGPAGTLADDIDLIALARQEARIQLGVTAAPALTRVSRFPRGMPQYALGHPGRLARIEQAVARHEGLALAGAAYRGVGLPDCIASGERAAGAVAARLSAVAAGAPHTGKAAS